MMKRFLPAVTAALLAVPLLSVGLATPARASFAIDGVFSVGLEFVSSNVWDGEGYVWTYKLTGLAGNNRGLSHVIIETCPDWFRDDNPLDFGFFDGGVWRPREHYPESLGDVYDVETGTDPTTGLTGIKYDARQSILNSPGQMEYFAFRLESAYDEVLGQWAAKDGNVPLVYGTVITPGCDECDDTPPVPEPASLLLLGGGLAGAALLRRRRR